MLRRLPYKRVQFAVTEYGIDGAYPGAECRGLAALHRCQRHAEQLLTSGRYTERFSGRALGYAVYTLGHNAPWGSYDINGDVAWASGQRELKGHLFPGWMSTRWAWRCPREMRHRRRAARPVMRQAAV
ncbi:MAG: hypothetical protein R3A10_09560 [Caldilineaceae bacterium]